ncbi:hypothetical protein GCM10022252_21610 [Streptosporangium oxazolinicum]|uniref:Beta-galactosidase n=1 Tax=Streptosporangium oxazolinicum TaxID=909287 RepID=A0ABP8AQJ4_9ACTN
MNSPHVSRELGTLAPSVELRTLAGRVVPYAYGRPLPGGERQRSRRVIDLAGRWRGRRMAFDHDLSLTDRADSLAAIESDGFHSPDLDDSRWALRDLPACENGPGEPYEDGIWYRRRFTVAHADGERVRLTFTAVNYVADVWVNGRWIGWHEGGYTPFALDITDALTGGENVLVVRVDNPPWGSRTDIVPAVPSDWWNYTGIIQDVYLEILPAQSIARLDVVPSLNTLSTTIVAEGAFEARLRLHEAVVSEDLLATPYAEDLAGPQVWSASVSGVDVATLTIEVPDPRPWSPETPHLYVLIATLPNGDAYATQVGLRTVAIADAEPRILLNGRAARFHGVARHEDWADTGRTVGDPQRVVDDLTDIKSLGVTLLRTGHYPNHPLTYLVADRVGLAVMEEIPTWWFEPYQFADQLQRGIGEQMWREMIFRDYNRPSVLLWGGTNESMGVTYRAEFLRRLLCDLRLHYDDGRLITQTAAPDRPGPHDATQNVVDVPGWSTYFGVFMGEEGQESALTAAFLDRAHEEFPGKPILVTEFGTWAREDDGLAQRQLDVFAGTHPAYDRPYVAGAVWWTAYDWFTPIAGFNTFGLTHIDRRAHRPARAALRTAYRAAAPSTSGPPLAPRRPAIPLRPLLPQDWRVAPQLLADFAIEDTAHVIRDATVERVARPELSTGWAGEITVTGPETEVGFYLYHRPVDLSGHELFVRLLNPAGDCTVRLLVEGVPVYLPGPLPAGRWTTLSAGRVSLTTSHIHVTVAAARGQRLYVDGIFTKEIS